MPVYLDHNAIAPLDSRVVEVMLPYLTEHHGNPSSSHCYGPVTRAAADRTRMQVTDLVNARHAQVIFTSGGTEASNHAIKSVVALTAQWLRLRHMAGRADG